MVNQTNSFFFDYFTIYDKGKYCATQIINLKIAIHKQCFQFVLSYLFIKRLQNINYVIRLATIHHHIPLLILYS